MIYIFSKVIFSKLPVVFPIKLIFPVLPIICTSFIVTVFAYFIDLIIDILFPGPAIYMLDSMTLFNPSVSLNKYIYSSSSHNDVVIPHILISVPSIMLNP